VVYPKNRTIVLGSFLGFAATAATLAISSTDPFLEWAYEFGVFLLAAWALLTGKIRFGPVLAASALLPAWGYAQAAAGATVYRYATLNAALRGAALAATALVSSSIFQSDSKDGSRLLRRSLDGFAWLGFLVGVVSLVAYYTSPGSVLWLFPSPYPDVWGPFLSRNNFAQFLELALPASLWVACTAGPAGGRHLYFGMSAAILACGLVSASRAGAILLLLETCTVFALTWSASARRTIPLFAAGVTALAAVAGGEVLLHRLRDPDPFQDRREIFEASLSMIGARPWSGYGLGNFATVYPEFARYDPGAAVEHAHNDWLEWSTEGGLPYAAAWMLLLIAVLRPAFRSIWGIGVPAVFAHALIDDPFARLGVAAWAFILMGALESNRRTE
jgi:O-antigen ligase